MKTEQRKNGARAIPDTEHLRIVEAYLKMVSTGYRAARTHQGEPMPAAHDLYREADRYARDFIEEENTLHFHIGVSDYKTNRALVYLIEAARCACAINRRTAIRLLLLAITDMDASASADEEEEVKRLLADLAELRAAARTAQP